MSRRTDIAPVGALPEACIRWAMLERNGYRIELFKYYGLEGLAPRPPPVIALKVSDVDDAYRRVIALGLCTVCPPKVLRGGMTKVIYLIGPEDNVIELIELCGRGRATPQPKKDG